MSVYWLLSSWAHKEPRRKEIFVDAEKLALTRERNRLKPLMMRRKYSVRPVFKSNVLKEVNFERDGAFS
jgi:hypothetical protein